MQIHPNDRIRFEYDADAGTLIVFVNEVSQGVCFSDLQGAELHPAIGFYSSDRRASIVSVTATAPAAAAAKAKSRDSSTATPAVPTKVCPSSLYLYAVSLQLRGRVFVRSLSGLRQLHLRHSTQQT